MRVTEATGYAASALAQRYFRKQRAVLAGLDNGTFSHQSSKHSEGASRYRRHLCLCCRVGAATSQLHAPSAANQSASLMGQNFGFKLKSKLNQTQTRPLSSLVWRTQRYL